MNSKQSSPELPEINRSKGRIILMVCFVLLIVVCWLGTRGIGQRLVDIRNSAEQEIHFYNCEKIISGDTVQVRDAATGVQFNLRFLGIEAPPLKAGPEADAYAQKIGKPAAEIPQMGAISQKTLQAWLYKRPLVIPELSTPPQPGALLVSTAGIYGVDIGAQHLEGGQVMLSGEDHAELELYQKAQVLAQTAKSGIWR